MSNNIGGSKRKSRFKLKKERRAKGKVSITKYKQTFEPGQKVHLGLESSYHKGEFHARFYGMTGTVKSAKGKCYEVKINDKGKEKLLIIHPVHLKAISN